MTLPEWKDVMREFIDGVERELGPSIPANTKIALSAFRRRLNERGIAPRRKRFERELEAFLESEPVLEAAATQYLRKKIRPAVEEAVVLLKRVETILAKASKKKRR